MPHSYVLVCGISVVVCVLYASVICGICFVCVCGVCMCLMCMCDACMCAICICGLCCLLVCVCMVCLCLVFVWCMYVVCMCGVCMWVGGGSMRMYACVCACIHVCSYEPMCIVCVYFAGALYSMRMRSSAYRAYPPPCPCLTL